MCKEGGLTRNSLTCYDAAPPQRSQEGRGKYQSFGGFRNDSIHSRCHEMASKSLGSAKGPGFLLQGQVMDYQELWICLKTLMEEDSQKQPSRPGSLDSVRAANTIQDRGQYVLSLMQQLESEKDVYLGS